MLGRLAIWNKSPGAEQTCCMEYNTRCWADLLYGICHQVLDKGHDVGVPRERDKLLGGLVSGWLADGAAFQVCVCLPDLEDKDVAHFPTRIIWGLQAVGR